MSDDGGTGLAILILSFSPVAFVILGELIMLLMRLAR